MVGFIQHMHSTKVKQGQTGSSSVWLTPVCIQLGEVWNDMLLLTATCVVCLMAQPSS